MYLHIKKKDTGLLYFKDLELYTIELTKFSPNDDKKVEDMVNKESQTVLERGRYYLG